MNARSDARQARAQWGDRVEVVVVDAEVAVGTLVADAEFRVESRPRSLVPDDALGTFPDVDDRIVAPLQIGETLTERDLLSTRAARVDTPAGTRAVAVPTDATFPPLEVGDLVDVVLLVDTFDPDSANNRLLDDAAVVLLTSDDTLTLAVRPDDVAPIATALTTGRVAIALR